MREVQGDWTALFEDFRQAHSRGVDPASEEAQALAGRFQSLIDEFTGGDADIEQSLGKANAASPTLAAFTTLRAETRRRRLPGVV